MFQLIGTIITLFLVVCFGITMYKSLRADARELAELDAEIAELEKNYN